MRNRLGKIDASEFGRVRFKGRTYLLGTAPLKGKGLRGVLLTPKSGGRTKVGAILVSDHLPAGGDTCRVALIHETLHVAFPRAKEADVEAAAFLIDRVLSKASAAVASRTPAAEADPKGGRA